MRRWIVILACLSASAAPGFAESTAGGDPRVAELERKVEVLTQEIESLKLGAVAETTRYESRRVRGGAQDRLRTCRQPHEMEGPRRTR